MPLQALLGEGVQSTPSDAIGFLRKMLWNLPLIAPAAWGAWWFNRKAHLYDRLGEEYRQKEAISKAFVGYTKQLKDLDQTEALNKYLVKALEEICVPAGRVYDKKLPPGSPLEEHAGKMIEEVTKK